MKMKCSACYAAATHQCSHCNVLFCYKPCFTQTSHALICGAEKRQRESEEEEPQQVVDVEFRVLQGRNMSSHVSFGKDYKKHFGDAPWTMKIRESLISVILYMDENHVDLSHFTSNVRDFRHQMTDKENQLFRGMGSFILCLALQHGIKLGMWDRYTAIVVDAMNLDMTDNYNAYVAEYLEELEDKYGKVPEKDELTNTETRALMTRLTNIDRDGFTKLVNHYKNMSFRGDGNMDVDDVYSSKWLKDGDSADAPTLHMKSTVGSILDTCEPLSEKFRLQVGNEN
jgi:hypothetical protein